MASQRQLEANRANAMKSTGPNTPEGKAAVAGNAIRHSIWAKVEVLPDLESQMEWEDHLAATVADWAPQGYMEEVLTEQVALLLWRLGRVARFEREAIAVSREIGDWDAVDEDMGRAGTSNLRHDSLAEIDEELDASPRRIEALGRLMEMPEGELVPDGAWIVRAACDECGLHVDSPDLRPKMTERPEGVSLEGVSWSAGMARRTIQAIARHANRAPDRLVLAMLDTARRGLAEAREEREVMAGAVARCKRSRMLPPDGQTTKVLRYETHLDRLLHRAMHELRQRQAARGGEPAIPPETGRPANPPGPARRRKR